MLNQPIRIALLGAGDQAERWAAAFEPDAMVLRTAGPLPDRCSALVVAPGAGDSFRRVKDALLTGLPVLYAAPFSFNPWQAEMLDALSRRQGRLLRVAEPFQHEGGLRFLQRLSRGREPLWRLRYVRTNTNAPARDARIEDLAIEDLAICQALLEAQPLSVAAMAAQRDELGDVCSVFISVRYPQGVVAQCTVSLVEPATARELVAVTANRTAALDRLDSTAPLEVTARREGGGTQLRRRIAVAPADPIAEEARGFAKAVATCERSAGNSGRWVRVAALWWAARQSMSFGGEVDVPVPAVPLRASDTAPPPLRVIEGGGHVTRTAQRPPLTLIAG